MMKLLLVILFLGSMEIGVANIIYSTNSPICSISVEMESNVYISLVPIKLNITVTNRCSSELLFKETLFDKVEIIIIDSNSKIIKKTNMGNLLYFSNSMNSGQYSLITLKTGEALEFDLYLNQLFDLTLQDKYSVEMSFNIVVKEAKGLSYHNVKLTIPVEVVLPQSQQDSVLQEKVMRINIASMSPLLKQRIYTMIEETTCELFRKQLDLQSMKSLIEPIETLININSKKVQPVLIEYIDLQIVDNGQTNYPCFEALKETGVPFKTFTNELQNVESGSKKEELFLDLGNNLYGEIFQLYLEQKKQE